MNIHNMEKVSEHTVFVSIIGIVLSIVALVAGVFGMWQTLSMIFFCHICTTHQFERLGAYRRGKGAIK